MIAPQRAQWEISGSRHKLYFLPCTSAIPRERQTAWSDSAGTQHPAWDATWMDSLQMRALAAPPAMGFSAEFHQLAEAQVPQLRKVGDSPALSQCCAALHGAMMPRKHDVLWRIQCAQAEALHTYCAVRARLGPTLPGDDSVAHSSQPWDSGRHIYFSCNDSCPTRDAVAALIASTPREPRSSLLALRLSQLANSAWPTDWVGDTCVWPAPRGRVGLQRSQRRRSGVSNQTN